MNGLNQVRSAVLSALTGAGVTAVAAYDGTAQRYEAPVAAVDLAAAAAKTAGLGSYLGTSCDAQTGEVREIYGRQIDMTVTVELRAPSAAECETAMETAAEVLLDGLPSGIKPSELAWEAVCWDSKNQLFLRRGSLSCRTYFTAESSENAASLLDFTLKGVITDEQYNA